LNLTTLVISTPDFVIDEDLLQYLTISVEYVPEGDCQINEGCVSGSGERILARFDTGVANIGTSDFAIGDPEDHPNTVYDPCHQHYHFTEWMEYQVFALDDTLMQHTLIDGFKQGFCLVDVQQYDGYEGDPALVSPTDQYDCNDQGISVGWMDIYDQHISCQYADITNFSAGTYVLRSIVNPSQIVEELDYTNNYANTTFYFDGTITSYYWSDYTPSRRDVKTWRQAMNSLTNDISNLNDTTAAIFDLFQSGADFCTNPGGCIPEEETMWFWYMIAAALTKFQFKVDPDSIIYGTGYWFAETEWTMISKSGCKFRKSHTDIHSYYNSDGTLGRTRVTSEENNAMELFFDYVVYPAFIGEPFYCRKGDEYLYIDDDDDDSDGSAADNVGFNGVEIVRDNFGYNDETKYVTKNDFNDAMINIYRLLTIFAIPIVTMFVIICLCQWMNRKKMMTSYEEVDNNEKE